MRWLGENHDLPRFTTLVETGLPLQIDSLLAGLLGLHVHDADGGEADGRQHEDLDGAWPGNDRRRLVASIIAVEEVSALARVQTHQRGSAKAMC